MTAYPLLSLVGHQKKKKGPIVGGALVERREEEKLGGEHCGSVLYTHIKYLELSKNKLI
jgi:hypothetical protein